MVSSGRLARRDALTTVGGAASHGVRCRRPGVGPSGVAAFPLPLPLPFPSAAPAGISPSRWGPTGVDVTDAQYRLRTADAGASPLSLVPATTLPAGA